MALGTKNPYAKSTRVYVDSVQWSAAQGEAGLGEATGPADAQRVIFGYTNRKDYVDSQGHAWRPAAEYVVRLQPWADLEPLACWTEPKVNDVADTKDAELYRYGVHGKDFTAYFTVDPKQTYHVRIKLCQADAPAAPGKLATSIAIQGKPVAEDVDIAATAGGLGQASGLGLQRHQAGARRHCHSFLEPLRRRSDGSSRRNRPRQIRTRCEAGESRRAVTARSRCNEKRAVGVTRLLG